MSKNQKKYTDWSKEELISRIVNLEERKKYGLVWEEDREPEEIVLEASHNLPVLKESSKLRIDDHIDKPTNILIQGDNYHALSVLNYTHHKAVDVIYVDPPYNTGARDWRYNNKYVDDADGYRHSKWLSFMKNRLVLAKNLLKPDGIICITIDDYELPRLWLLMEDIFYEKNHLGTVAIRINPGGRKSKKKVALQHEYALFFSGKTDTKVSKIQKDISQKSHDYKQDEEGNWYEQRNLRKEGQDSLAKPGAKRYFPIYRDTKTGKISSIKKYDQVIWPHDTKGQKRIWRRGVEDIDKLYETGDLFYKETKYGPQIYFKFKGGLKGETPKSFWEDKKYSASEHGTRILDNIMGAGGTFPFPKSIHAVKDCIKVACDRKDAIVLDFFAGSGTTGQAVLELNKEDGGSRTFILVTNNENNICEEVTYPRVRNVITGYTDLDKKKVEGIGGNLRFFKTDFIKNSKTDKTREEFANKSIELLCIKEGVFKSSESKLETTYKFIGKNKSMYVLFDQMMIDDLKLKLEKDKTNVVVYIFSLGDDDLGYEFEEFENVVVKSIPESILRVYRKIFK